MGGIIKFSEECYWFMRNSIYEPLGEAASAELLESDLEARAELESAIIHQALLFDALWQEAPTVARRLLIAVYKAAERLAGDEGAEDSMLQSAAEDLAELFRSGRVQQTLPPEHSDLIPILDALKPTGPVSKGGLVSFGEKSNWWVPGKVALGFLQALLTELPSEDSVIRAQIEESITLKALIFDYFWENSPEVGRRLLPLVYQVAERLAGPEGAGDPYSQERYARLVAMFRSGEVQRTLPPEHADLEAALPPIPADPPK